MCSPFFSEHGITLAPVSYFLSHFSPLQNQADLNLPPTRVLPRTMYHAVALAFSE